jgi:hypothetical protein
VHHKGSHQLLHTENARKYIKILPVVLYVCETSSPTLREEQRMRVFKNKALREYLDLRKGK